MTFNLGLSCFSSFFFFFLLHSRRFLLGRETAHSGVTSGSGCGSAANMPVRCIISPCTRSSSFPSSYILSGFFFFFSISAVSISVSLCCWSNPSECYSLPAANRSVHTTTKLQLIKSRARVCYWPPQGTNDIAPWKHEHSAASRVNRRTEAHFINENMNMTTQISCDLNCWAVSMFTTKVIQNLCELELC